MIINISKTRYDSPNTQCVTATTPTTENELELLPSPAYHNMIRSDYFGNLP